MFKIIRDGMAIKSAMQPLLVKLGESKRPPTGMDCTEYALMQYRKHIKKPYAIGFIAGYVDAAVRDLIENKKVASDKDSIKRRALSMVDDYNGLSTPLNEEYNEGYSHGNDGYEMASSYGHKALVKIRSYLRLGYIR